MLFENYFEGLNPLPPDIRGWSGNAAMISSMVRRYRPELVIEVGTWKGQSAINMAETAKAEGLRTTIVCVDTWLGSREFWNAQPGSDHDLNRQHGYPQVYYQFLSNVFHRGLQDRIKPLPATASIAARLLNEACILADLIYIDGSHDEEDVLADLKSYWPLRKRGAPLFGHDYRSWPGVRRAVDRFKKEHNLVLAVDGEFFILYDSDYGKSHENKRGLNQREPADGKFVPLPLGQVANIVTTKSMFHAKNDGPDRLIFDDWSPKRFAGAPFQLIDPRGASCPNAVLLYSPWGTWPPKMPKSVKVPCNTRACKIHLLSGVSGWGYPALPKETVSMIVRLHYEDATTEDVALNNGEPFADYIRRVDVPGSQLAFMLGDRQLRYLAVYRRRDSAIREVEFLKGNDHSAPLIMATTLETP